MVLVLQWEKEPFLDMKWRPNGHENFMRNEGNQIIRIPIEDWIDLHTFSPKEIPSLLEEYLIECQKKGFQEVRIIHGKGKGIQRSIVHSFLKKSPIIASFTTAPTEAGDWGATIARLKKK